MAVAILSPTAQIIDLFYARTDVLPYQYYSPQRQMSGYGKACTHRPPWLREKCKMRIADTSCGKCDWFDPLPVDEAVIARHLNGEATLGSYQLAQDGSGVKWAVLDFDDHGESGAEELQTSALIAKMLLDEWHLPCYIEASGGTGWRCHLWLFFQAPVAALKARAVLEAALGAVALHDKPYIERFPKQARVLNGYGNLVKLPFGKHQKTGKRSTFLDPEHLTPIPIERALAEIETIDPAVVDFVIDSKGVSLEQAFTGEVAPPTTNFNRPAEVLNGILNGCWYFKELQKKQRQPDYAVSYEDWWQMVLLCCRYGEQGVKKLLEFSALDERHDPDYTLRTIDYLRAKGYHQPSCKRLREGPGQLHCPNDPLYCGAPVAIAGAARETAKWHTALRRAVVLAP